MGLTHSGNIVTDGLVLCLDAANRRSYPGTGTAWTDLSGSNNNGTLTNGPTFSSGNNGSIVFDGTDDYVSCGIDSSLNGKNTSLTLSGWAYLASTAKGAFIKLGNRSAGSGGDGFAIGVGNTSYDFAGSTVIVLFEGIRWIDTAISFGTGWHHFALVINSSGKPTIYKDSVSIYNDSSTNANTIGSQGTAVLQIGGYSSATNGNRYYTGNISNAMIYNRALSAVEVKQNYNVTRKRFGL